MKITFKSLAEIRYSHFQQVKREVVGKENAGYRIHVLRRSKNPLDNHLFTVLGQNFNTGQYVTWNYNSEDGGFFWGHYFEHFEAAEAVVDFYSRSI
jgi:hypothetical protein